MRIDPVPSPVGGTIEADQADAEIERLRVAVAAAGSELDGVATSVAADGHPDEAAIFEAQASIARDPALITLAASEIREKAKDAIGAIQVAAGSFAEQLRALDDELLAARSADVLDVGQRIARRLAGKPGSEGPDGRLDRPAVVVAQDLAPSVTATLPRERLVGIALEGSSPTAHAAILARAYNIPAVVGIHGLLESLESNGRESDATEIAIDGGSGEIVLWPDEATRKQFDALAEGRRDRRRSELLEARQPATTLDGVEISLLANIGTPDESDEAVALGAQGVGLFRTEFLFLERSAPPTEDEQVEAYQEVVRAFSPHPVTIRLLDVGGDKPIPYLRLGSEANPFLGVRALRIARRDPTLFVTQLRACYRAAAVGPIKVMAPMVADAGDVDLLLSLARQARDELTAEGRGIGEVVLGVMLEIPSSIFSAGSYFSRIAFVSLGTNDLLQYILAVDRGNPELQPYRDPLHPSVLTLVRMAVEAGDRAGIDVSVCGEMAGDPASALALVALGVRSLSMASSSLPAVRRCIRSVRRADLAAAIEKGLSDPSAAAVRARLEPFLRPGESS